MGYLVLPPHIHHSNKDLIPSITIYVGGVYVYRNNLTYRQRLLYIQFELAVLVVQDHKVVFPKDHNLLIAIPIYIPCGHTPVSSEPIVTKYSFHLKIKGIYAFSFGKDTSWSLGLDRLGIVVRIRSRGGLGGLLRWWNGNRDAALYLSYGKYVLGIKGFQGEGYVKSVFGKLWKEFKNQKIIPFFHILP